MRIALIGMSGAGKSYWSHRLARSGFERFGCDDHIGRELAGTLGLADSSLEGLGRWMGYPHEDGFADREAQYLDLEHRVMSRFLSELEHRPEDGAPSLVIDTTGSLIYLGDDLRRRLQRATVVVYLAAPPEKRQALLAAYRAFPRPVVWQGHFRPKPGEDSAAALERNYMDLLADRDRHYRTWAHVEIEMPSLAAAPASSESLLGPVRAYLKANDRVASP
ncbi:MAG: shikimate kinase [Desulfobacterales bacterium]